MLLAMNQTTDFAVKNDVNRKGSLSVESENIFPVIKKWLYREQDIFVRELISNASDAITKLRMLNEIGEYIKPLPEAEIRLEIDKRESAIRFIDNGIGMDAKEISLYINQIAFSGATHFLSHYKEKVKDDQIIGHFGLGFYSAFMAAEKVAIQSLSAKENAVPVCWECDDSMKFTMENGKKESVGTEITLYLSENSKYLNPDYLELIIRKYFDFFPIQIVLSYKEADADGNIEKISKNINEVKPLWMKKPEECVPEDYLNLYKSIYKANVSPVLWLHIYNEELGVKGIVFFRTEKAMNQTLNGSMKLYSNQVFVSDNAKEVIPEFLFFQDGIVDCQKIPLTVSRADLQKDENAAQISKYIAEQVALKIYGTYFCERQYYEKIWEDLNPFLKYSCVMDRFFSGYVEKYVLFKSTCGKYVTLEEHLAEKLDSDNKVIFYISDEIMQAHYIKIFKQAGIEALYMTHVVDQPFIEKLEAKHKNIKFRRVDSDFYEALKADVNQDEAKKLEKDEARLKKIFEDVLVLNEFEISCGKLKVSNISSLIISNEEKRRIKTMIELYAAKGIDVTKLGYDEKKFTDTLFINTNNKLVQFILTSNDSELKRTVCLQLVDLAKLGQESLMADEMADFIERSNRILEILTTGKEDSCEK